MTQAAWSRPGAQIDTWVRSTLDLLAGMPAVWRAGLAITEGAGRRLLFTATDRDNRAHADWCEVDAYDDVPLNNAVRTGTLVTGGLRDLTGRYPEFISRQGAETRAIAAVPLSVDSQTIGGFTLYYRSGQSFDEPQLSALRDLGLTLGADLRRSQRGAARLSASLADEPAPAGARATTFAVQPDPRAVGPARHVTDTTLSGWGVSGDSVESAVLCVSELVTNAVIHTVAGCEVRLVLQDDLLTVIVRDAGTGGLMDPADDPLAVHGRGLGVVEALASRWGVEEDSVGMTVWCELSVA